MKKFSLLWLLIVTLVLTACGQQSEDASFLQSGSVPIFETSFLSNGTHESIYTYTWQMLKPTISEMSNREAMNSGFEKERSTEYLVEKEFADNYKQYCNPEEKRDRPLLTNGEFSKELLYSDVTSGNLLTLTGLRHSQQLLDLTTQQQQQVSFRGWTIVGLDALHNFYKMRYDRESAEWDSYDEERVQLSSALGGVEDPAKRYPFNTLLITNDLLLHVYHKLFDNSLKYYEEQIARPTLVTLSEKLYTQYLTLSKQEKNPELKEIYEFLTAYWAVPHILAPKVTEMFNDVSIYGRQEYINSQEDLTDDQIRALIEKKSQSISETLAPAYQTLIPRIVDKVLKATDAELDSFLAVLAQDFLAQPGVEIKQDYTQFKPRSHYTDSSLLKTYFMAMKWLMREKFYFGSANLTKAALVMTTTIDQADLTELNQLSEQIKNLIGSDDDLTLNELTARGKKQQLSSPTTVLNKVDDAMIKELAALHPQKIQSTTYETSDCMECVAEANAKAMTDGFVFFGEKFTLDSYIFDLMTAGSAEVEFIEKPNMQTALIVPDILEDSALANQLVQLRLQEKSQQKNAAWNTKVREDDNHTQLSSYEKVKSQIWWTFTNVALQSSITQNIYHKRLRMLGLLLQAPLENAPYRYFDPLYQLKSLLTYMGSYTELKHDTLLYVKQAYAEMGGGGGDGSCTIYVQTPELPVPRGYVEAQPDFLDALIALNAETIPYFTGTYGQANFVEFGKVLERFKDMSIKQMHNETISDEDFERLRIVSDQTLRQIVIPMKTIGSVSQKEMRGALIADIFTSEGGNPLYEAIGRPALMLLMVNDVNGARVVVGPIFTQYEFYGGDGIVLGTEGRYTDLDRQAQLRNEEGDPNAQILPQENRSNRGLSIVSKELKKWLEKIE